jgi:pimeloyl-ACP methyl ester carboxylesterase
MTVATPNVLHRLYELFAKGIYNYFSIDAATRLTMIAQLTALGYSVDREFNDPTTSFQALGLTYKDGTRPPVLVFQGTVDVIDAVDDANPQGVGFAQFTANKEAVKTWLQGIVNDRTKNPSGFKVSFVGHSLGGSLVQWFASEFPDLLLEGVSFQSTGISKAAGDSFTGKGGQSSQISHYVVNGDLVSLAGEAFLPGTVYLADYQTSFFDPGAYSQKHLATILESIPGITTTVTNLLDVTLDGFNRPSFQYTGEDWQDFIHFITKNNPELGKSFSSRTAAEAKRIQSGSYFSLVDEVNKALAVINADVIFKNDEKYVLEIAGQATTTQKQLKFKVAINDSTKFTEVGFVKVDDDLGSIDGKKPGDTGYLAAALNRAQTIFSVLPTPSVPSGFTLAETQRTIYLDYGTKLRLFTINDYTLDSLRQNPALAGELVISEPSNLTISKKPNLDVEFKWRSTSGIEVAAVVGEKGDAVLGIATQTQSQKELIDLRQVSGSVAADISIYRSAAYNNHVYFYSIVDELGSIFDSVNNKTIQPGHPDYTKVALQNAITGIDLSTANNTTNNVRVSLAGGNLIAPIIVIDGDKSNLLDSDPNNDRSVYTPFITGNGDSVDRVRLLGDNTFGFEDLAGGGDRDYNDIIVKATIQAVAG